MSQVTKRVVLSSLIWKFMERGSAQLVSFVVSLVLARLLGPADYGLVSLVLVFTTISLVLVQGGFNSALVQKRNASDLDYSSVLAFSFGVALLCYVILFIAAPAVANFYGNPEVTAILRVMALVLLPGAYNSVQVAYAEKSFQFKKLFIANLSTSLGSGVLGIALAFGGAGVWALVAQQLGNQFIICIVLVVTLRWHPKIGLSVRSIKKLFSFGANVFIGDLLVQIFLNLRNLIVGKLFDETTLGLFNRGNQFPSSIMTAITGSLQQVMLPTFSDVQTARDRVLSITRRSVQASCLAFFPLMIGLASIATPLVRLLLGDAWLGCIPYLQIFAISYYFHPMQIITAQAMRGLGDSKTTLKIEIVRKTAELGFMFASIPLGPLALAASSIVAGLVSFIVALVPNVIILNYTLKEQLHDITGPLVGSVIMGLCLAIVALLPLPDFILLALQILIGGGIYLLLEWVFKQPTLRMAIAELRKKS